MNKQEALKSELVTKICGARASMNSKKNPQFRWVALEEL